MATKKRKTVRYIVAGASELAHEDSDRVSDLVSADTEFRKQVKAGVFGEDEAVYVLRVVRIYRPKTEPEYTVEDFGA